MMQPSSALSLHLHIPSERGYEEETRVPAAPGAEAGCLVSVGHFTSANLCQSQPSLPLHDRWNKTSILAIYFEHSEGLGPEGITSFSSHPCYASIIFCMIPSYAPLIGKETEASKCPSNSLLETTRLFQAAVSTAFQREWSFKPQRSTRVLHLSADSESFIPGRV